VLKVLLVPRELKASQDLLEFKVSQVSLEITAYKAAQVFLARLAK